MNRINLIFGTNNTQALGNHHSVFEKAYQSAYKPFLRVLYKYPDIPAVLYYSGTLLEWLESHHSEFLDVLAEMSKRKQIELLGGAFYEPVLSLIPRQDRLGQIERLTTLVRKRFGRRPRGGWIPEQVWEPSLASSLKSSGLEYIFLDGYHFEKAGFTGTHEYKACITEDQGRIIKVIPILSKLRKEMVNNKPEAVISALSRLASKEDGLVAALVYEGERFGYFGNSSKTCYDEKWLEHFLSLISENKDWINIILPYQFIRQNNSRIRGYFPASSYEDMRFWSLDREDLKKYRKSHERSHSELSDGGYYREFLTQYPESNYLYAKMQYTHILVNQIRGDKYRKQAARNELWKGQCHFAYWHNHSGGIYLNHLRKKTFSSLIEAEKVTRERGIFIPSIITTDLDMDGINEYLYQGNKITAYVHTQGGMLFELDYLPASWNYLDSLSRQPEYYHDAEVEKRGYDWYPRKSFIDHFLAREETIEDFDRTNYKDLGCFIGNQYDIVKLYREKKELLLRSEGRVRQQNGKMCPVEITKYYHFKPSSLQVDYTVKNTGDIGLETIFASETNLSFFSHESEYLFMTARGPEADKDVGNFASFPISLDTVSEIIINDLHNNIDISMKFQDVCTVWSLPIITYALTEDSFLPCYQASCFLPHWNLEIEAGKTWKTTISLEFYEKD